MTRSQSSETTRSNIERALSTCWPASGTEAGIGTKTPSALMAETNAVGYSASNALSAASSASGLRGVGMAAMIYATSRLGRLRICRKRARSSDATSSDASVGVPESVGRRVEVFWLTFLAAIECSTGSARPNR